MLILRKNNENSTLTGASIEKNSEGWKISLPGKESFFFKDADVEFYPDLATLWFGVDGPFLMWASETTRSKSGYMNCLARHGGIGTKPVASFFIDANGESHLFYYGEANAEVTGVTPIVLTQNYTVVSEVFKVHIPSSVPFFVHQKAKKNLLARISPEDSLAMLEAELDLLISVLIESNLLQSDAFTSLCESIKNRTADTASSKEKLLQTIQRQKTHLRKYQKIYFESRGAFTDGDFSA